METSAQFLIKADKKQFVVSVKIYPVASEIEFDTYLTSVETYCTSVINLIKISEKSAQALVFVASKSIASALTDVVKDLVQQMNLDVLVEISSETLSSECNNAVLS